MRVVFSQDIHDPGDPEFEIWPEHALRGTWGWEMIDELTPRPGELVVQKVRYDAFYGTELDHMPSLWPDLVAVSGQDHSGLGYRGTQAPGAPGCGEKLINRGAALL